MMMCENTIQFGWWLAPLAGTILLHAVAAWFTYRMERSPEGRGILGIAYGGLAMACSLLTWILWAVLL